MNHHRLLSIASRTAILSVAALAASAALAWSGPPGSPTTCPSGYAGCDAPLNVSATGQTKSGTLYVSAAGNALTGNSTTGGWGGVFYGGGGVYAQNNAGYYTQLANGGWSIYGNGSSYLSGSYTGSAYYYSSDARLKKDIEPLHDSLSAVLKLRPVTYEWKDASRGAGEQLGFIAQEVEAVVPQIVHGDASTGMLSVDYARVVPLLVGAVQAQQAQLEVQQQEIDVLKAEVAGLTASR